LQLDRRGAELLFQVLTEREERSAIAIASNEPFSSWAKTFTDPRLCAAIVDRLTFAGQIIETGRHLLPAGARAQAAQHRRPVGRTSAAQDRLQCQAMLVADLHHFFDLPPDPGPARQLGEHLGSIVAAATAGDAHTAWESALPCRRRPANRRCPGRIIVICTQPDTPIGWHCSRCGDDGTISNWAATPYDLRRQQLALAQPLRKSIVDTETAATLRTLPFLDIDCQRAVFAIRACDNDLHLAVADADLDELIGAVAAEANHEPNRRRQQRLDAAFEALNTAAQAHGW
jgi:IstB-like ATP binding protein